MSFGIKVAGSSLLTSALLCSTALADVAPRDVWDSWRTYLSGFGYDITASEQTSGDALNVNGLTMTMQIPEEEGTVTLNIGDLQFIDAGDGTVKVVFAEQMPINIDVQDGSEDVDVTVMLSNTAMNMVVSGTPDKMVYDYSADAMMVDLAKIIVDGIEVPGFTVNATMAGIVGSSTMVIGESVETSQQMTIDTISYVVNGADPEGNGHVDLKGGMTGLAMDFDGLIPLGDYSEDPTALFEAGFDVAGGYRVESSNFDLNFMDDGKPGTMIASSGPGELGIEFNDAIMSYGGKVTDVQLNMMGAEIPLPIDVSFGELGYGFAVPIKGAEEPQEFGINLTLVDMAVSEMIWGMFDPGQVLPHDPATLVIDITGLATVFTDLLTLDETTDEIPGELNAMSLNDLQLHVAGASVTGAGDFTFDNSDMQSFDGFPRPQGQLDLSIIGVNGLMDKLVQMGLLPEQDAMGARMGLSMFSVPGAGEDELTSTIVINEQGHVLANGQRLK